MDLIRVGQFPGDRWVSFRATMTDRKGREKVRSYLHKRLEMMNYGELRREDLDIATGAVEGAVRHVRAKRFDSSGMRWIGDRAQTLLQLRCIEINGDWDPFMESVVRSP
jgi:hypothetical protein